MVMVSYSLWARSSAFPQAPGLLGGQHLINTAHHRFIRGSHWINRLSLAGTRWKDKYLAVCCLCADIHRHTKSLIGYVKCVFGLATIGTNFGSFYVSGIVGLIHVHLEDLTVFISRTTPSLSTSLTLLLRAGFTLFIFRMMSRKARSVYIDLLTWNNQNENRKDNPSSLGSSFWRLRYVGVRLMGNYQVRVERDK
jgi:hypothetical protein